MRTRIMTAALCLPLTAHAQTMDMDSPHAADRAPMGVMADRAHMRGEGMLMYRYDHMAMSGSLIDDNAIPNERIPFLPDRLAMNGMGMGSMTGGMSMSQPASLRMVPLRMDMDMHMFGGMYAPADWLTVMAMGSVVAGHMPERVFSGDSGNDPLGTDEMDAAGLGDTSLLAIVPLFADSGMSLNVHGGVSLPTGSTVQAGSMLMQDGGEMRMRLPYDMQLGSGTWDLLPGATLSGRLGRFGWGAQYWGVVRTGRNGQGYRLGDAHTLTAWGSYEVLPWLSLSLRAAGDLGGRIRGMDPAITMASQSSDPMNYGGERLRLLAGANVLVPGGALKGLRLGVEAGAPVYQRLNGPQLAGDWQVIFGVEKGF